MKKLILVLTACLLIVCLLTGCDRGIRSLDQQDTETDADFAPETTASAGSGLTMAVEDAQEAADTSDVYDQPAAVDTPMEQNADISVPDDESDSGAAAPVASAHSSISGYAEIANEALGFSFSYPVNWENLPGRSTICFKQSAEETETYPARVCITMKKLAHKANASKAQEQLVSYLKTLRTQYDASTFEVDTNLNTKTKFMGNNALSCTYLAYDGNQEIEGYVILTYFDKYVYCFHFLSAYDDFKGYHDAMCFMKDSAKCTFKFD